MTRVDERLTEGEQVIRDHIIQIEALTSQQEDPYAALADRHKYVADLFHSGAIDTRTALQLAMYTTCTDSEGSEDRELRMNHMTRLVQQAQTGEIALASSVVTGFTGGIIDGPLEMRVDTSYGGNHFAMHVPFAQMPDEPRYARLPLGHMLVKVDSRLAPTDYLYVGQEQIAAFARERGFESLRPTVQPNTVHMSIERDGKFLVGLYQAGITLAECGINDETRAAIHQELNVPFGGSGKSIGEVYCRSLPQALHVVTMDHLA